VITALPGLRTSARSDRSQHLPWLLLDDNESACETRRDNADDLAWGQASPLVYKLDGSESKNTVTRDGQQQERIATATWDGKKLAVATQVSFQGNTREQRRVLAMEGGNLVIDQTNAGRGGGGTPAFYDRQRAPGALEKSIAYLLVWGIPRDRALTTTILVTAGYFALMTSFYFLIK
jgi:hypothetical protein